MRVVKPAAVNLDPNAYETEYAFIEKVGRTCYKSEDRITGDSAPKFVKNLVSRGHFAMLEHAYVYVMMGERLRSEIYACPHGTAKYLNLSGNKMSASMRAMKEFLDACGADHRPQTVLWQLSGALKSMWPEIFGPSSMPSRAWNTNAGMAYRIVDRTDFVSICRDEGDTEALTVCLPHTILFTVDRGVTHELVRHRPAAFAQESSRFCSYIQNKFGSEITVVEPFWMDENADKYKSAALSETWHEAMLAAEDSYFKLLKLGALPQEARAVLPQSTKADIVVTATESEWKHILDLRAYGTTGAPHPDMRRAMLMAAALLNARSNGRLFPEPYAETPAAVSDPEAEYVFWDHGGDTAPATLADGRPMKFPLAPSVSFAEEAWQDDAGGDRDEEIREFLTRLPETGLIPDGAAAFTAVNPFLDHVDCADMTGTRIENGEIVFP